MSKQNNDLTEIIAETLNKMKMELGDQFDLDKVNLAEFERRTGISRAKLRRIKENGYGGGKTSVKKYIREHKSLLPAKRYIEFFPNAR